MVDNYRDYFLHLTVVKLQPGFKMPNYQNTQDFTQVKLLEWSLRKYLFLTYVRF